MVSMELKTIYTEVIENITYNECEITSEDKSLLGQPRLALQIIITETINPSNIISQYTRRPILDFDRIIIDVDTSLAGEDITFDINEIEDMDDIKALIIRNPSEPKRVNIKVNLNTNISESVTVVGAIPSISILRFENCVFKEGISVMDRTKILIEFYSCDIYDAVSIFENRKPYPVSSMNAVFENCSFYDIKTFLISRLINISMVNTKFINSEKPESFFKDPVDGEEPPAETENNLSDYIDPSIKISGCDNVDISSFEYKNILSSVEIIDCKYVSISNISGSHQIPNKPSSRPIVISGCVDVSASGILINGLRIDSCEKAIVAGVRIAATVCSNAAAGVMISRISKEAIVSSIEPDENTVMTGCSVSMCEGDIVIADAIMVGIPIGVYVNGCSGNVSIVGGIYKNLTNCAVLMKSLYGDNKILDSVIMACNAALYITETKNFEIIGAVITGRSSSGPDRNKRDMVFSTIETLRAVESANFSGVSMNISTARNVEMQNTVIERSIIDISNISSLSLRDTIIMAKDVVTSENLPPFMLNLSSSLELIDSRFEDLIPDFRYIENIKIQNTDFFSGLRLRYGGGIESEIRNCNIGDPDKGVLWKEGVLLDQCKGIGIFDTKFNSDGEKTVLTLNQCNSCIVDDSNIYGSENLRIEIYDGKLNNNHFILPTKDTDKIRPKLSTSSEFKNLLYFLSIRQYRLQYGNDVPKFRNVNEVMAERLNIVSYVDRNESWVPSFISKVNDLVKDELNSI
jgi:hypothetical protein